MPPQENRLGRLGGLGYHEAAIGAKPRRISGGEGRSHHRERHGRYVDGAVVGELE
jgi:hypothetical protein